MVVGQWFTLFVVKHQYDYPIGWDLFKYAWRAHRRRHAPILRTPAPCRNKWTYIGIFASICITGVFVYTPPFQAFLPSGPIGPVVYLMPVAAGTFMIAYECVRKYARSKGTARATRRPRPWTSRRA